MGNNAFLLTNQPQLTTRKKIYICFGLIISHVIACLGVKQWWSMMLFLCCPIQ